MPSPRCTIGALVTFLLLTVACSDANGPQVPEALVVRDSTALAGINYAASQAVVTANRGATPALNCPGGNPAGDVHISVTPTAVTITRRSAPDTLIFDWSADLKIVTPAIPVTMQLSPGTLTTCGLTIDTRLGTDTTVHATGTAEFKRTRGDGPIDRLDLATTTTTGLATADVSLGGSLICSAANLSISVFLGILQESLFHEDHLCGAPGAAVFMRCKEN